MPIIDLENWDAARIAADPRIAVFAPNADDIRLRDHAGEALADARGGVDVHARKEPAPFGRQPRERAQAVPVEEVREPVPAHGVKARIAQEHLPGAARSRVPVEHTTDVASQRIEHIVSSTIKNAQTPS